ncbi:conserved hypothetical protein [Coccidioides posadasii str. Silveira]|uniref:Rhodopsin domain-containing protein n=2 Tax=Coccidioides posadasii TaxID=199306 RepID=E9DIX6_COCPS|nr:conserved hypothetical protein [Coccidioides posadasii str. Silveira]KMM65961.1 hypothetical protein CPAG_02302 [Coccidioides posadasii RMSCC 3488]
MIAALPVLIGTTIQCIDSTKYGWGIHIWDNKKEWYSPSRLASWVNQVAYIFLMNLIRTSILVSYLQFFTTRGYRVTTWFLIGTMIFWWLAYLIALFSNCL